MNEPFWDNRFHWCALAAGFLAASEGRLDDSLYVKDLAHGFYESGAFRDRVPAKQPAR
jgi:glycine/D-amino acid oxidase-like deaminating enzyme